jgi:hypothetical protein
MKSLFKFLRRNAGLIALTVVVAYFVFLWVYSSGSVEGFESDNDVLGQTFVWAQIVLNGANTKKKDQDKTDSNLNVGKFVSDDAWIKENFQSNFMKDRNPLTPNIYYNKIVRNPDEMAKFTEDIAKLSAISNSGTGQTMDGYLALAKEKDKTYINGVPISTMVTSDIVQGIEACKSMKGDKTAEQKEYCAKVLAASEGTASMDNPGTNEEETNEEGTNEEVPAEETPAE